MSPEEASLAILELKMKMLERKLDRLKTDLAVVVFFFLIVMPFVRSQDMSEHVQGWLLLAAAAGIMAFGVILFVRDRRDAKRDAERLQNIYLSIRPTSP